MKVGEARGGERGTDAVVLGETQLFGLHLETRALYVDETGVYVLFTRTSPGPRIPPTPLLHPLLRSPISTSPRCLQTSLTNPLLHPPTLSHPLPSSPALQALYLALISLSLKPSPCSPASFTPTATPSSLSFSSLSICLSLSLSPSFHSPPPLHRSYPLGLCTAARLMRGRISLPVL